MPDFRLCALVMIVNLLAGGAVARADVPPTDPSRQAVTPETPTYTDQWGYVRPMHRTSDGYFVEPGREYTVLPLPRPINRSDLALWAKILVLSDAQRAELDRLFDDYASRELAYHLEHVQDLWEQTTDLIPSWQDVGRAETLARLMVVECARARRELEVIERRLFDELEAILAETQIELLGCVKRLRQRDAHGYPARLPGVKFDIILALHWMHQQGFDLKPHDPELFDELLFSYEVSLTSLIFRCGQQRPRLLSEAIVGVAKKIEFGSGAAADAVDAVVRRRHRRIVGLEKPIYTLNSEYVELLSPLLPEEAGQHLTAQWLRTVYPTVYPDRTNAAVLLDAAAAIEDLTPEQREKIAAIRAWYELARQEICERMARRYMLWRVYWANKLGYDRKRFAEFDTRMRQMHNQRCGDARAVIDQLAELLDGDSWDGLNQERMWLEGKLDADFVPDPRIQH